MKKIIFTIIISLSFINSIYAKEQTKELETFSVCNDLTCDVIYTIPEYYNGKEIIIKPTIIPSVINQFIDTKSTLTINITIVNESLRTYKYKNNSFYISSASDKNAFNILFGLSNGYLLNEYNKDKTKYNEINEYLNEINIESKKSITLKPFFLKAEDILEDSKITMNMELIEHSNIGKVIVYYIDSMGEFIDDKVSMVGKIGETYITEEKQFDNYKLVRQDGFKEGIFKEELQEIYYMYDKEELLSVEEIKTGIKDNNFIQLIILLGGLIYAKKNI